MLERCRDPRNIGWKDYGGRGITVCDRWLTFENFLADMGERPLGRSIDRLDHDGHYEPDNCRWATAEEQANNKRNSAFMELNGVTKTITEWSREHGISENAVRRRLSLGWSLDRALTQPSRGLRQDLIEFRGKKMLKRHFAKLIGMEPHNVYIRFAAGETSEHIAANPTRERVFITIGEETLITAEWSRRSGVERRTIAYRIKKGWPPEKAVFYKEPKASSTRPSQTPPAG
jgi:hypothetical protein